MERQWWQKWQILFFFLNFLNWLIILHGFLKTFALAAFNIHSCLVFCNLRCLFFLYFRTRIDLVSLPLRKNVISHICVAKVVLKVKDCWQIRLKEVYFAVDVFCGLLSSLSSQHLLKSKYWRTAYSSDPSDMMYLYLCLFDWLNGA